MLQRKWYNRNENCRRPFLTEKNFHLDNSGRKVGFTYSIAILMVKLETHNGLSALTLLHVAFKEKNHLVPF